MGYLRYDSSGKAVSDKGTVFPTQYVAKRGIKAPYIPTAQDMKKCGNAKFAGQKCPRKIEGSAPLTNCATCSLHPGNIPSVEE